MHFDADEHPPNAILTQVDTNASDGECLQHPGGIVGMYQHKQ